MRRLIIIFLAVGIGATAIALTRNDKPNQKQALVNGVQESKNGDPIVITYTDNGFSQPKIKIKSGTTVKWVNHRLDDGTERGRPMWVASDVHPEHTIYPEFDQARPLGYEPIGTDSTYEFTFNKSGRWEYHDHYDANMKGIITVE